MPKLPSPLTASARLLSFCLLTFCLLGCGDSEPSSDAEDLFDIIDSFGKLLHEPNKTPIDVYRKYTRGIDDFKVKSIVIMDGIEDTTKLTARLKFTMDDCAEGRSIRTRFNKKPNITMKTHATTRERTKNGEILYNFDVKIDEEKIGFGFFYPKEEVLHHYYGFTLDVPKENWSKDGWITGELSSDLNVINFMHRFSKSNVRPKIVVTTSPYHATYDRGVDSYAIFFEKKNNCGTKFEVPSLGDIRKMYDGLEGYRLEPLDDRHFNIYYQDKAIGYAATGDFNREVGRQGLVIFFHRQ